MSQEVMAKAEAACGVLCSKLEDSKVWLSSWGQEGRGGAGRPGYNGASQRSSETGNNVWLNKQRIFKAFFFSPTEFYGRT